MLDCLVVGGGPAGLTAAIYLARFRRKAIVIDEGKSRAALIASSHNYPGFADINGRDLLERLRKQAMEHGSNLVSGRARSVSRDGDIFIVETSQGSITARTLLLATGLVDSAPPVEGFPSDGYAGPIRFCPVCDGFEALDKRVGVLGDWEAAYGKACFMRTYSRKVLMFPVGRKPAAMACDDSHIRLCGPPRRVIQEGERVIVEDADGQRHELDVLYPALGCKVNSELAAALGASCDPIGLIHVNAHQRTSIAGLYAAGDVVSDLHQISVATAHAAIAATGIHNHLAPNLR
jgi:thioredoxin reductase (NADPH)